MRAVRIARTPRRGVGAGVLALTQPSLSWEGRDVAVSRQDAQRVARVRRSSQRGRYRVSHNAPMVAALIATSGHTPST